MNEVWVPSPAQHNNIRLVEYACKMSALGKWRQDDHNVILGCIGEEARLGCIRKENLKGKRRNREGEEGREGGREEDGKGERKGGIGEREKGESKVIAQSEEPQNPLRMER